MNAQTLNTLSTMYEEQRAETAVANETAVAAKETAAAANKAAAKEKMLLHVSSTRMPVTNWLATSSKET